MGCWGYPIGLMRRYLSGTPIAINEADGRVVSMTKLRSPDTICWQGNRGKGMMHTSKTRKKKERKEKTTKIEKTYKPTCPPLMARSGSS